jgi:alkylhydroperoxidase family enzyme
MELAECRVGALNGAAFEWMHHMPLLKKAGVSDEGIERVRTAEAGRQGRDGEGGVEWTDVECDAECGCDRSRTSESAIMVFEAVKNEMRDER